MKKNKKAYKTPSVKTILLRQQAQLLTGSNGVEAERNGYTTGTEEIWD